MPGVDHRIKDTIRLLDGRNGPDPDPEKALTARLGLAHLGGPEIGKLAPQPVGL